VNEVLSLVNNLIDFYKTNPIAQIHSNPQKVKSAPPVSFIMTLLNERDTQGFWQSLVDSGFIKRDINNYDNFIKVFTDTKVFPLIEWYADIHDLYYLFNQLRIKNIIVYRKNDKWLLLQNSFKFPDFPDFKFKDFHSSNGKPSMVKISQLDSAIAKLALQC
jgi:hypothetical protein